MLHFAIGNLPLHGVDPVTGARFGTNPKRSRGWWGTAASTIQVVQRARASGGWAGDAFSAAKHLSLGGLCVAPSPEALEAAAARLATECSLGGVGLTVNGPGGARTARVRREGEVSFEPVSDIAAEWSIQLVMTDPRKFGADLTVSTGLPSTTGGLEVPFTIPFTIDAVTISGQVSLINPGNTAGPVRLRIDGPVTGPIVTHVGSGRALVFSSSLELLAGEFITVDMERREVLAQGQSSRNGWVTGRGWSTFEPGSNTWSFSALAHDAAASLTVTATPAWE